MLNANTVKVLFYKANGEKTDLSVYNFKKKIEEMLEKGITVKTK
jgi:hypothetical protein